VIINCGALLTGAALTLRSTGSALLTALYRRALYWRRSTDGALLTASPFSGTTQVSRYQKGKTNLHFTGARDSEWQWHQLGHMQVCTLLQIDNHTSTLPLFFAGRMPFLPPNQQRQSTEGTNSHIPLPHIILKIMRIESASLEGKDLFLATRYIIILCSLLPQILLQFPKSENANLVNRELCLSRSTALFLVDICKKQFGNN